MSIPPSPKVCYKSPPAVTKRQGHQKRIMGKKEDVEKQKTFMLQSCFLITRQNISSTFRCQKKQSCRRRWIQGQASAVTLCQRVGQTYNMLASSWKVLNVTVHRLIWHNMGSRQSRASYPGTGAGLLSVKFGWCSTLDHIYCTMSTLAPLVSSKKYYFVFGPKQQTVALPLMERQN